MPRKPQPASDTVPGFYIRWAAVPWKYSGEPVDPGQLISLNGNAEANERLLRLGYIAPFDGGESYECAECGKQFVTDRYRTEHGNEHHRDLSIELDPEAEEAKEERRMRRMNELAPLHMEKTKATLGV